VTDEALAAALRERALLHGRFTLRSGRVSSVYLDKYRFETDPALLRPVALALARLAGELASAPDRLAGPALGAVPLVTAMALELELPFVIVREAGKAHGTANRLEGRHEAGDRVLLVEDVVTSGGAALAAVEALREAGLVVEHGLCVLDREEGGVEALREAGVSLVPLFRRAALGLGSPETA
jgi:orotate phosphoribosyltransferase